MAARRRGMLADGVGRMVRGTAARIAGLLRKSPGLAGQAVVHLKYAPISGTMVKRVMREGIAMLNRLKIT